MTRPLLAVILVTLAAAPPEPVSAQDLLWTRQAGTTTYEFGNGVAVDSVGNAYLTGYSNGSLFGPNAGLVDAFLAKYDASGAVLWTRQLGTAGSDAAEGIAVDSAGSTYMTGFTVGNLGGTNAGISDIFLAKYDAAGTLLWTRQTGTSNGERGDSVAVDSAGNAYITGYTDGGLAGSNAGGHDLFLAKYDASGTLLWTRQTGTAGEDRGTGVAVDGAGNAYLTGYTEGSLGGSNAGSWDIFLSKYDPSGVVLWTRQIGTSADDRGLGVAADDAGNVYFTGYTYGSLFGPNSGGEDGFLAKYDASGAQLWTKQFGTSDHDSAFSVAVDSSRNAYITGGTYDALAGTSAGGPDVFLAKYDASGTELWTRQIGTSNLEVARSVAVDGTGNAYITGETKGSLGGTNAGNYDVFLAKFGPSPCPADFNHDGFVNGDDFDSFSLAFINGDAAADFDGNGFVNGDDFDAYVAALEAGC